MRLGLEITYKSRKLEKVCTDAKLAVKEYGKDMAEKIQMRIDEITAAETIEMMIHYSSIQIGF